MALPNDPFTPISAPPATNTDLPAGEMPSLARIEPSDLVGPTASNRQHQAMERRALVFRDRINKIIDFINELDVTFLRRDGSAPKDDNPGLQGDVPANAHTFTGLRAAIAPGEPVRYDEFQLLATLVSALSPTPPGVLGAFVGATAPAGWIPADGSTYSSAGIVTAEGDSLPYPGGFGWGSLNALRLHVGAAWGGDGIASFSVPDYRGRTVIGAGTGRVGGILTGRTLGTYGGEEGHALTEAELAPHSHSIPLAGTGVWGDGQNYRPGGSLTAGHLGTTGSGAAHNTMQPWAAALICIKY